MDVVMRVGILKNWKKFRDCSAAEWYLSLITRVA
jgi:hypothetical protein